MSYLTPERNDIPYVFGNEPKGCWEWIKRGLLFFLVLGLLMGAAILISFFFGGSNTGEAEPPASWCSGIYCD